MTLYVIGDIHGQIGQLDRALSLVAADGGSDAAIVFLGDYTDRGPDSRAVLDRLISARDAGRPWTFIKGNHDRMFLRFLTEGREHDSNIGSGLSWINRRLGGSATLASYGLPAGEGAMFLHPANGGRETLSSYDIGGDEHSLQELVMRSRDAVPDAHRDFLADLPLWHEAGELLFVHAGIRPGIPLEDQDEDDLIWIRDGWLDATETHPWLIVHGHTALDFPEHYGNRVNLDSGAGYGRPLVPAVFEGRDCWTLGEGGRSPLLPAG